MARIIRENVYFTVFLLVIVQKSAKFALKMMQKDWSEKLSRLYDESCKVSPLSKVVAGILNPSLVRKLSFGIVK